MGRHRSKQEEQIRSYYFGGISENIQEHNFYWGEFRHSTIHTKEITLSVYNLVYRTLYGIIIFLFTRILSNRNVAKPGG